MLYVVGGVARAGKSQVATAMNNKFGVPWLSLDALRWGLGKAAPILGIDSDNDDREDAERIWPIIEAMAENILFDGRDYLMEGVCLTPQQAASLISSRPQEVRACFLGYPHVDLSDKVTATMRYEGPNDWLRRLGVERATGFLSGAIQRSATLRSECDSVGIPFIDTGSNYLQGIDDAVNALTRQLSA